MIWQQALALAGLCEPFTSEHVRHISSAYKHISNGAAIDI